MLWTSKKWITIYHELFDADLMQMLTNKLEVNWFYFKF